jgi:hypothetical protein
MRHAEKCPVCEGKGRLPDGKGDLDSAFAKPCHGCSGKGWVEVGVDWPPVTRPREGPSPMELHDWHTSRYALPDPLRGS